LGPLSGDRFLFANRRKNRVKVLYWDGSGLVVLAKRFEHGVFVIPSRVELTMDEMEAILNGVDLQQAERPKRYRHRAAGANLRSRDPPAA